MAIQFPSINGMRHDFSSVIINLNGLEFGGVKDISWTQSLKPSYVRGTSASKMGRTRGQFEAEGKLTMYLSEGNRLVAAIAAAATPFKQGFMEFAFPINVQAAESGLDIVQHDLLGCRITNEEHSRSEGGEALVVSYDLDIMTIVTNKTIRATLKSAFI